MTVACRRKTEGQSAPHTVIYAPILHRSSAVAGRCAALGKSHRRRRDNAATRIPGGAKFATKTFR